MKVVWVSSYGGNYNSKGISGTGGWVAPLETAFASFYPNVELGLVFPHPTDNNVSVNNNVTYIPIKIGVYSNIQKFFRRLFHVEEKAERECINEMVRAIITFKPDIVHIWGCENYYASIIDQLDIPCVIHIQGIVSSCINVFVPPFYSPSDLMKADGFINARILRRGNYQRYKEFLQRVAREQIVIEKCDNWIGRTSWDENTIKAIKPLSKYYHCDELIRDDFFSGSWSYHYNGLLIIQSTVSDSWYKGIETILKTAIVLSRLSINFEWNVCGINETSSMVQYIAKKLKISPKDVSVNFLGSFPADIIKQKLLDCDVYVHPSHIENSSNAICEAMCLGVPVVAEYIGGNPTMLKEQSGILVQPYDPYVMASAILKMKDKDISNTYSLRGRVIAKERHNPAVIVKSLFNIYCDIVNKYGK